MNIQFKNGPGSVIEANSLAGAYLAGEPAYSNNTNSLYIGGVLLATGADYLVQGTQPADPANPSTAKSFWFDTVNSYLYIWKYTGGTGTWVRVLSGGAVGPAGPSGGAGVAGPAGSVGPQGVRGASFLSGSSVPTSATTANDGDYYLHTTTKSLYGPRTTTGGVSSWGGAISLKGETGDIGVQGIPGVGTVGPAGSKIFYGNEVPTSLFPSALERREGDFYIDLLTGRLYGGYTLSQGWGAGVSLLGLAGPTGPSGPSGTAGLEWKGAWASGTTYPIGSVVESGGSSYVSIKSTSNSPSNAADWGLVALKGSGGSGSGVANIIADSPILWNSATSTISFSVPDAVTGSVLKYDGTSWVAGTSVAAKSINSGTGAPTSGDGVDGDFYMQMAGTGAPKLFGPKVSGAWGSGVSLLGASGQNGIGGPAGADGTPGMEWNGTWSSLVNYSKGAVVYYLGGIYICEINNTLNITPNTTLNWDLLVAKGEQGEPANLVGTYPVSVTTAGSITIALSSGSVTGQVMTWNNTSKAWEFITPNAVLSGLTDVTLASSKQGEVLTYNGTKWINGEITIDSLSDVVITAPVNGQALVFNGLNWANSNTVKELNATLPLNWNSGTSTLKIGDGTKTNQVLLWDQSTKVWNVSDLPSAKITANTPLYWDSVAQVLAFGIDANAGEVLVFDGVNWVAGVPHDHSRPTILWGEGVPPQGLGHSGDFYIDTIGHYLYGPKCSGCLNNKWTSIQAPVNLVGPIGNTGASGTQGVQGVQGVMGNTGAQGLSTSNLIRKIDHIGDITTMPPNTNYNYIGVNGDFLLLSSSYSVRWYGPKANNAWPTSTYIELKGTEGVQGIQGIQGVAGPQSGQMIHYATINANTAIPDDPSSSLGAVGDLHITILNTSSGEYVGSYLFGPKTTSGTDPWGTPVNLRGASGPTGAAGAIGPAGPTVNPTTADITGGLFNTGTTQNPALAVKTTSGTGLTLKTIAGSSNPFLALELGTNGLFYMNGNSLTLKPRPNNSAQRRSFFGI